MSDKVRYINELCTTLKKIKLNNLTDIDNTFQILRFPSDVFERYFDYQDKFIYAEINLINNKYIEKVTGKNVEEQVYWFDMFNEFHLNFLESTFPDIQHKSNLVLLFNSFENNLKLICKTLSIKLNTPIDYSDLNGDDLVKCQKYLIKVCDVNEKLFKTKEWEIIDCFRKIRNTIVHNNSDVTKILKSHTSIIKELTEINGFVLIGNCFGIFKSDLLRYFINVLENFHEKMFAEIDKIKIQKE